MQLHKTRGLILAGALVAMLCNSAALAQERPSIVFSQELSAMAKTW